MIKQKYTISLSASCALCIVMMVGIFLCPASPSLAAIQDDKIIELTNLIRTENKSEPLSLNKRLSEAAHNKARAIFDTQTFSHSLNGQSFSSWIKQADYEYSFVGENLAMDFATEAGAINAWLASPTHKDNLLNPEFTEIGIAVERGEFGNRQTTLIVQIFGKPRLNNATKNAYLQNRPESEVSQSINPAKTEFSLATQNYLPRLNDRSLVLAQTEGKQDAELPFAKAEISNNRINPDHILFPAAAVLLLLLVLLHYRAIEKERRQWRLPMCLENKEQLLLPIISDTQQIRSSYDCGHIAKSI